MKEDETIKALIDFGYEPYAWFPVRTNCLRHKTTGHCIEYKDLADETKRAEILKEAEKWGRI